MPRGRKPKPTALKELAGNPGKRKPNSDEPKPKVEIPTCPPHLMPAARKEWKRLTQQLDALGMVSQLDRVALATYCQAWARWIEAQEKIDEEGSVIIGGEAGYSMVNPWVTIANKCAEQMARLGPEFGLTPSARSRLKIEKKKEESPLSAFLKFPGRTA